MVDVFKPLLARLASGQTMDEDDAELFFTACLSGEPTPAQIAAAVTCMRLRGETTGEITACARAMRRMAVTLQHPFEVIDVCGTGGDGAHTFNISTAVAFVVAGAGVRVAKHGNRAVSSRSGTADVLAALGVDINADTVRQRKALEDANLCFLFAPAHHGAMRHVLPIRQELGFRTVFNLLGPLANPANAQRQLMGVYDIRWVEPLARVLGALGSTRAWVVHGEGLDEITTTGETHVAEWREGQIRLFTITPEAVGLPRSSLAELRGGDPKENATALLDLLSGAKGAYRDITLLNAAAALLIAGRVETLREGVAAGAASIDEGRAKAALDSLVKITTSA